MFFTSLHFTSLPFASPSFPSPNPVSGVGALMFYCILLPKQLVLPVAYLSIGLDVVSIAVFFSLLARSVHLSVPSLSLGLFFASTVLTSK